MGIDFKNLVSDVLPQFRRGLGNYASREQDKTEKKAEIPKRSPEEQSLFELKAHLIDQARAKAHEKGEQFSLEHYRKECESYATTEQGQAMAASGKWKPAIYADLSGQNLNGIRLSDPKSVKSASLNKPGHQLTPATQGDYDSFDRDGDGQINNPAIGQFYDEIRLNGASLRAAFVEPATSFNEEIAKAKNLEHMTFSGMTDGDKFTLGAGALHKNIRLENIKGGSITIPDGTQVEGMDIRGANAELHIGRASVSHLDASDARIVTFTTAEGAEISHSKFNGTTIGMGSQLNGSKWTDVEFNDANLGSVDMRNVTISNVRINRSNTEGLDLSGAAIDNLSINGILIQNARQLNDLNLGIKIDETTKFRVDPELLRKQEIAAKTRAVADIGKVLVGQMGSIGTPTAPAAQPPAQTSVEVAAAAPAKTAITFSGNVNLNDVALTTAVASLERTVPLNEQASGTNMQRDTTA